MKSLQQHRITTGTARPQRNLRPRTTNNIDRAATQSNLPVQLITIIIERRTHMRKIPVEVRQFQRITIIDDDHLLSFLDLDTIVVNLCLRLLLIRTIPMLTTCIIIIIIIIIVRVHRDIVTIVDRFLLHLIIIIDRDTFLGRLRSLHRLPRYRVMLIVVVVGGVIVSVEIEKQPLLSATSAEEIPTIADLGETLS